MNAFSSPISSGEQQISPIVRHNRTNTSWALMFMPWWTDKQSTIHVHLVDKPVNCRFNVQSPIITFTLNEHQFDVNNEKKTDHKVIRSWKHPFNNNQMKTVNFVCKIDFSKIIEGKPQLIFGFSFVFNFCFLLFYN